MEQICQNNGKPLMTFDEEALVLLQQINWTGNIRELRNVIERLTILCDGIITGSDIQHYAMA
jgi:DNA-binding NtrC family response regulator